jgi:hypothetical protein
MLRCVALVRTNVSKKHIVSITSDKNRRLFLRGVLQLLVTVNVVLISPIIVTLMTEAMRSCETLVLTRATWYNSP